MVNKKLRILIADRRHTQSLLVERLLNRLGYHRIATASSLEETRILGRFTGQPFDVLIVSGMLIAGEPLDAMALAGVSLNVLVYQRQYLPEHFAPLVPGGFVTCLQGPLELAELGAFMAQVDPLAVARHASRLALHP